MKRAFKFGQIQLRAAVICSILASSHKYRGNPGGDGEGLQYIIIIIVINSFAVTNYETHTQSVN